MTNLLQNGSFNAEDFDGPSSAYSRFPVGTLSGLLPEYWYLVEYARPGDPKLPNQDQDWNTPEIIPIKYLRQFPERELLWPPAEVGPQADDYVLKGFRGGSPTGYKLGQTVKNVPAGRYSFIARVFPDQWTWDRKRPGNPPGSADWYNASEVLIQVDTPVAQLVRGWLDARTVPIGQYSELRIDFDHPGGDLNVFIACRGRWGFQENGWFWDACELTPVSSGTPAPTPTPTPVPTPTPTPAPQPGPQPGTVEAAQAAIDLVNSEAGKLAEVAAQLLASAKDLQAYLDGVAAKVK